MPRVLHIITNFAERGGAEFMMARLVNALPQCDQEVVSLKNVSSKMTALIERADVPVSALGMNSAGSLFAGTRGLASAIRRTKPDVIVCWMYHAAIFGTLAARLARFEGRLFWNIRHSLQSTSIESRNTKLGIAACRLMSSSPDGVIFLSERSEKEHLAQGWKPRARRSIHNGVNLPPKPVIRARRPLAFGMAARFNPAKDYGTMLKAAQTALAANREISFFLAGRGVSRENSEFMQLVNALNIPAERLTLCDEVSDMREFFRQIDIFVLSSRTEGFGNVLIEAMSEGIPCISTDSGDAAAIIGDTGFVVPTQNPPELAKAMLAFAKLAPDQYQKTAERAFQRVSDNFDIKIIAEKYLDFFNNPATPPTA